MTGFPLTNYAHIGDFLKDSNVESVHISTNGMLTEGPVIFHAEFQVTADEIFDTYLDVSGWGKVSKTNPIVTIGLIDLIFDRAFSTSTASISEDIGHRLALR